MNERVASWYNGQRAVILAQEADRVLDHQDRKALAVEPQQCRSDLVAETRRCARRLRRRVRRGRGIESGAAASLGP